MDIQLEKDRDVTSVPEDDMKIKPILADEFKKLPK